MANRSPCQRRFRQPRHKTLSKEQGMADQSDKIRVLIVDDIADTRDNLEKLLFFEKDMQVVGKAGTGREAITQAKQLQPDVILMDINMPDMDGIAATEAITTQVPNTEVIMMSVQGETDYLRRAMLAGARQFLTKPVGGDELASSIREVYRLRQSRGRVVSAAQKQEESDQVTGQIIAVYSPKGGTGKSAVACNLAVALKLLPGNRKVCLVDANLLFGDVGVMFNINTTKTINDLTSRITELDTDLLNDVMSSHASGIKVLVAPPNPQMGELVTADHLRAIMEALRREYDYVVVDTQSSFQDQTMAVLDSAARIVLLMTMELSSIKNIRQFLEVAELLEYGEEKLVLVLNKADPRFGIRVDQVEANIQHKVAAQIGNAPYEMTSAINRGVPLIIDKQAHQVSSDITNLAYLVSGNAARAAAKAAAKPAAAAAKKEEPRGLFARLTKR
ncbi:MAG TPA: response regulator [Herpetosiphonaceae bacterium]|nr:response regulator [Herpetosiphonaceae bacterium]